MKNIRYIIVVILTLTLNSCHDLELEISTQLTEENFPTRDEHFVAAAASAYSAYRSDYAVKYWFLQTLSTDEAIMPARGGNWYDLARYEQLHKHSWNADHGFVLDTWNYLSNVVANTNKSIALIGEGEERMGAIAELRALRALAYFMMMDLWGNIPVVTKFGDVTLPSTTNRADVFLFIENELKESLPYLSRETGVATYGRPTKYTAYALLAKMYLNAEVYAGTSRVNDAIVACDSVINSGKYQVESDYKKMFFFNNGPAVKEFIFAVPFNPTTPSGYMLYNRYWLPRSLRAKYSLNYTPSAPMSTIPSFYAYFDDDNDIRKKMWLTGKQYLHDGTTPVTVNTTKKGYDEEYTGADAGDAMVYHVELTPDIVLRGTRPFDCGNDEKAWNMGYRNLKFYPDSTSSTRNQNTDLPVFRYSDILLMKAEAILRGGTATLGQTPTDLVNEVRSKRTTSDIGTVDLQFIYEERTREFVGENWHRNDMIRFGKYEDEYGFKTNADPNRRVFPIPTAARQLNPNLNQNSGY